MLVRGTNSGTLPSRNCQDHSTVNAAPPLSKSSSNVLDMFAILKSHSVYIFIYRYIYTFIYAVCVCSVT